MKMKDGRVIDWIGWLLVFWLGFWLGGGSGGGLSISGIPFEGSCQG